MSALKRFVRGFFRFWYDFIVGDDPKLALGVALVLGLGAFLVYGADDPGPALVVGLAVGLLVAFTVAMSIDVSRHRRRGSE